MSGSGAPRPELADLGDCSGLKVGVVAARWHEAVMDGLLGGALRALADVGVTAPTILRVPGTFELPVAAKSLADRGHDALIALGVVIRGDTPHFEYVCSGATIGLTEVSVTTGVPIGFGVLTCDTVAQALDRAGMPDSAEDKGYEAVMAAVETAVSLRSLA